MSTQKPGKLEDQAATAALYATRSDRVIQHDKLGRVDDSSRLSSAGASTSLKHSNARDLPSYPSAGLTNAGASAEAAASLANANHQTFEYWKPDTSDAASQAALLVKDYKVSELSQPQKTSPGSIAAALAATDTKNVAIWRPETTEASNTAAGQAMRGSGLTFRPSMGTTVEKSQRALLAATGAMSGGRRRSGSTPVKNSTYPDAENSAANAHTAASFATKLPMRTDSVSAAAASSSLSPTMNAARLQNVAITNLSREMYTSNPPVAPEIEEKNRQAFQRAAAISMAKQMYEIQQKVISQAKDMERSDRHSAASFLHNRNQSVSSTEDFHQQPAKYANLQEAAQKLAAERLAKLHDEHAAYRNYYGTNAASHSRLTVRSRPRRRASSDGVAHERDDINSKLSHSEMALIKENSGKADAVKRQHDRDLLMAAAQRNVKASMQTMDEKVFADTGRASPAMMEDWELKANARAKAASEARMVNHGKINIGGGKYLDQSEIDTIAAKRVQPTLLEISGKAALQRAQDAQLRHEEQERNRIAAAKVQEERERNMKTKLEWKRFRDDERQEAKARKDGAKAKRAIGFRSTDDNIRQPRDEIKRQMVSNDEGAVETENTAASSLPSPISIEAPRHSPRSSRILQDELSSGEEQQDEKLRTKKYVIPTATASEILQKHANEDEHKFPSWEQSGSAAAQVDEVEALLDVDLTLIDPALRESVSKQKPVPDTYHGEHRLVADSTSTKLNDTSVLNVQSATDFPVTETLPPNETQKVSLTSPPRDNSKNLTRDPSDPTGSARVLCELPETTVAGELGTQSTLSGDPDSRSPKGESKVSSWLRTKFGRRTFEPTEKETSHNGHPMMTLASPEGSDHQVADSGALPMSEISSRDEETSRASHTGTDKHDSCVISMFQPKEQLAFTISDSHRSVSGVEGATGDLPALAQSNSSSSETFEEAQEDHFVSRNTAVSAHPVDAGRERDKHVRDSKFQEIL